MTSNCVVNVVRIVPEEIGATLTRTLQTVLFPPAIHRLMVAAYQDIGDTEPPEFPGTRILGLLEQAITLGKGIQ